MKNLKKYIFNQWFLLPVTIVTLFVLHTHQTLREWMLEPFYLDGKLITPYIHLKQHLNERTTLEPLRSIHLPMIISEMDPVVFTHTQEGIFDAHVWRVSLERGNTVLRIEGINAQDCQTLMKEYFDELYRFYIYSPKLSMNGFLMKKNRSARWNSFDQPWFSHITIEQSYPSKSMSTSSRASIAHQNGIASPSFSMFDGVTSPDAEELFRAKACKAVDNKSRFTFILEDTHIQTMPITFDQEYSRKSK